MKQITSTNNPIIKQLKCLHQKKYRKEYGAFLLEGMRLVNDAIINQNYPQILLIQQEKQDKFSSIISACDGKCDVYLVSQAVINTLSMTESPEGIIASIKMPCEEPESGDDLVLVLDGVQDPGNLGTIIRTANSAGVKDIYLLGSNVDVYNPKVVRSTMGAIFNVNSHYYASALELYSHLRSNGYSVCVTTLSNTNYYELELPRKIALVLGNEGNGVSLESISNADNLLTLPMAESAESLNVAVCAGILIFDILHRR